MKIILDRASVDGTTPISKVESHISRKVYTLYRIDFSQCTEPLPLPPEKKNLRGEGVCTQAKEIFVAAQKAIQYKCEHSPLI